MNNIIKYLAAFYGDMKVRIESTKSIGARNENFSRPFITVEEKVATCGAVLSAYNSAKLPITLTNIKGDPITQKDRKRFPLLVVRDILYVPVISSIEYELLQIFSNDTRAPKTLNKMRQVKEIRTVYLSDLIKWVHSDGLLSNLYLWQFALQMRNDIVHYDAYARRTMKSPAIEHKIIMTKDKQIEGKLRSIIGLTKALVEDFFSIIVCLTKR